MSRIPKNKRVKKDTNNLSNNRYFSFKVAESFRVVDASYNKYVCVEVNTIINILELHLYNKMREDSILTSKVSLYDDNVFDYYIDVIYCYIDIIKIYKRHLSSLKSDNINIALDGLMSVIFSRIKDYEELNTKSINPITIEKEKIIDMYTSKFIEDIRKLNNVITKDINSSFTHGDITSLICQNNLEILYNYYIKYTTKCTQVLDLTDCRPKLNTYEKLLKNEEEVFSNIIKIQVKHLEEQKDDIAIVEEIFYKIRETYQHLCKNINSLETLKLMSNKKSSSDLLDFKEFKSYLEKLLLDKKSLIFKSTLMYKNKYKENKKEFLNLLNTSINLYIQNHISRESKANFKDCINNIKKTNKDFSNNIANIFLNIINYTNDDIHNIKILETESKVIEGIAETLNIKVESINDSIDSFLEEINTTYRDNNIQIPEKFLLEILELLKEESNNINIKLKGIESIMSKIIEDNIGVLNKYIDTSILDLRQKDINYKKDYILFEISTFEELINYSISSLKNSNKDTINLYVQVVEEANSQIKALLLKYQIITICPKPHDMFNGKEHEVIMVQKQDGFKKGEVIKVSSNGYKQNGNVLLRACVIAAK